MDEDLDGLDRAQLVAEVKRLRAGIREHRDTTENELCWHHPKLWGLLPERTDPQPRVPEWAAFMKGCVRYRQSLDDLLPHAPRTSREIAAVDPKLVMLRFNEAINTRDIERLVSLMTDDHLFVDPAGSETRGREAMRAVWRKFFDAFPDYENRFTSVEQEDEMVIAKGRSLCSVAALAGPATWTALVREGRVAEWRVAAS